MVARSCCAHDPGTSSFLLIFGSNSLRRGHARTRRYPLGLHRGAGGCNAIGALRSRCPARFWVGDRVREEDFMPPVSLACTLVSMTLAAVLFACAGGVETSDPVPEIGELAASRDSAFAGSLVPGYPDVVAEYLHIPGAPTPGTPRGLDTGAFLRVRSALDGEHPRH